MISVRSFFVISLLVASTIAAPVSQSSDRYFPNSRFLYFGTNGSSIYTYKLSWSSESNPVLKFDYISSIAGLDAEYVSLHPSLPVLYSVERKKTFDTSLLATPEGDPSLVATVFTPNSTITGGVTAFSLVNHIPNAVIASVLSLGNSAAFVGLVGGARVKPTAPQILYPPANRDDYFLAVATYSGGTVSLYKVNKKTGGVTYPPNSLTFVQLDEVGLNTTNSRQGLRTPHMVLQDLKGPVDGSINLLVPNLGTDHVNTYSVDLITGATTKKATDVVVPVGSGPRHIALHESLNIGYIINEVGSTITVYNTNTLEVLQTLTTLPSSFTGTNTASEVLIHPNGKFLYASNRGSNSIAIYTINQTTGLLTTLDIVSSGGAFPRYIVLVDLDEGTVCDGNNRLILLVANYQSPNLVAFNINDDGSLTQNTVITTPASVYCVAVSRPTALW
ncbi:hypothetical protein HK096_010300 [Nowakowskiella sp. JEL0078]|nr:hypothetical protein HK096_010300 [Nowakowskiella sp. JEL0078]